MPVDLKTPPAVSINQFIGGFKSTSDYTDLLDTETSDAENVEYGPGGDLLQRNGSLKILNTKLVTTGATAGRPITGHYHFAKLGSTSFDVVMAGDSIFNYNSSTASAIATSLTDNSQTYWTTIQVQDPRSASDDILLMSNGVDPIKVWNGSATAINLSAITSATQVPIAKYMLQYESRVYAANIVDSTDVDSPVKVFRTEIGSDGGPNPHRFTQSFFIGGSDSDGEIQGQMLLSGRIIYYTKFGIWRFTPGSGDVNDLEKVTSEVGLFAPRSLVSIGGFHAFLSERGVYTFDGSRVTHVSEKVDDIILNDTTQDVLSKATAEYDYKNNQYVLYLPTGGSKRNNLALRFDVRLGYWQPPVTGREVSTISKAIDSNNRSYLLYGDYLGYCYEDGTGDNDGIGTGFNDSVSTATTSIITATSATFPTDNDGVGGLLFNIISGTGEGLSKRIISNTSSTITLESALSTTPDATTIYTVGGIKSHWRSKDLDFVGHDITKLFRYITVRLREEGERNLVLHYIIDFARLGSATSKELSMLASGWAWGTAVWGQNRWGRLSNLKRKISLRNTNSQRTNGTHLAMRFSNARANETYKITGIDVEFSTVGKR